MHLNSIFLFFSTLFVCKAAQVLFPLPNNVAVAIKNLKELLLEKYPNMLVHLPEASDFDSSFVLGSFLFDPKNRLYFTHIKSNILIDIAEFETVIFKELLNAPANAHDPLCCHRAKLGAFVERTLDTKKLKGELESKKKSKDEIPNFLTLSELHNMVAECALDQLAVVSIDVAILNWVLLALQDKLIKTFLFSNQDPIVSTSVCNAVISLMFYPEIYLHVKDELKEFMGSLKGLPKDVFDSYALGVARLMLPLADGYHKQELLNSISGSSIHERIASKDTDVHLSDMLTSLEDVVVSSVKNLRKNYNLRTLLGASLELLTTSRYELIVSSFNYQYLYFSLKGQNKDERVQAVKGCPLAVLYVPAIGIEEEGFDIFVGSLLPLSEPVLSLLARYALRKDGLSARNFEDLLYAQGAFGISMIVAPNFF